MRKKVGGREMDHTREPRRSCTFLTVARCHCELQFGLSLLLPTEPPLVQRAAQRCVGYLNNRPTTGKTDASRSSHVGSLGGGTHFWWSKKAREKRFVPLQTN
jgi:hypothetical protein